MTKKRKRKPKAKEDDAAAAEPAVAPLPGAGTPDGAKLREAHVAFEAGDYVRVRARAKELEERAEDPAIKDEARALRERVEVDPVQIVVLLACAAVVVGIVMRWVV